jgi:uncharacterized membrane protein YhiD involved in acid resistance
VGLWFLAVLGAVAALVSLGLARRLARRLDALTQAYWELRYDYTRLRSQVARLDSGEPPAEAAPAPVPAPSVSFVPLASIRKKDA